MSQRIWMNTAQAADHAGVHIDTIRKAVEGGELHGTQRKVKGRWRIHITCLDAWCSGDHCEHQSADVA